MKSVRNTILYTGIKPSNIFVSDNGDFKLGDFVVARTLEKTSSGLSKKGTYTYMAPEVFRGESYGASVDTYSLGIVMYKLLNNNLEPLRKDRTYSDIETALKFPWGAPILTGTDCEIRDGYSMYRFGRSEHKECRVFVEQEKGIVSLKEIAPVSVVYHRILRITGLNDATVCIFPEKRGNETLKVSSVLKGDLTPVYYDRFEQILDPAYGIYYRGEYIFGDYTILLPR